MIAKITRGDSAGGLAAYLHGPGTGTRHELTLADGSTHRGGVVVASNIPGVAAGDLDGRRWARWLDRAAATRPEIKGPIWHCSLNLAPDDPSLTPQQWADAATDFVQRMKIPIGYAWAAVQHDDRGIHIAVSRVNDGGRVWHARNDRRQAQRARQGLEQQYQLTPAPTRKTDYGPLVPTPAEGVHEVGGATWRVHRRAGRLVTDRLGADGKWRLVQDGARTLAIALARRRRPSLVRDLETQAAANQRGVHPLALQPLATLADADPLRAAPAQQPGQSHGPRL